jgi:hypothetical protein
MASRAEQVRVQRDLRPLVFHDPVFRQLAT